MKFYFPLKTEGLFSTLKKVQKRPIIKLGHMGFWFLIGAALAFFLLSTLTSLIFQKKYDNLIYPGVSINNVSFGGNSQEDVKNYFDEKNRSIEGTIFVFNFEDKTATVSAGEINYGYDSELLSEQAFALGRSKNIISNLSLIAQAYFSEINLEASYRFSEDGLREKLLPIAKEINREPIDALFRFENGRVTAFRPSVEGRAMDFTKIKEIMSIKKKEVIESGREGIITIQIPVSLVQPELTTDKANDLGIRELIGSGTSTFKGSIESRVFNINLAASRINGVLIKPGETFSFNKALGDVSSFTGYKQAYVIQGGRTVLGDGGGVCQVSTTFFRAVLNSGMPIVERYPHSYRVSYYEQDSPPGLDATIYVPTVDFKFKNDTQNYILIQAAVDSAEQRITFYFYGQKDGREVNISTPVITNQTPPPEPRYEEDPTLPSGTVKQIDFAAWGANVYFTREVKKDGETIISNRFTSNYRPWQAVYLRGTHE